MILRIASYILLFVILSSCGGGGGSSIENTNDSITQPPNNPFVYIPPSTTSTDNCVAKSQPCLLYTSPSPRDLSTSRMPSSA